VSARQDHKVTSLLELLHRDRRGRGRGASSGNGSSGRGRGSAGTAGELSQFFFFFSL
jgi:hypothetical protein